MTDFLAFAVASWGHFLGLCVLIFLTGGMLAEIVRAARSRKP